MIRPEARKVLSDWREVIAGGVLIVMGCHWLVTGHTLQPAIGALLVLLGLALLWLGYRRVRFPAGDGGPGLVEVTERQITYLTAEGGGAVALDALIRVEVETGRAGLRWIFTVASGDRLIIPGSARGAEALFDALVPLPGINYEQAIQAARVPGSLAQTPDTFLIWQSDRRALH